MKFGLCNYLGFEHVFIGEWNGGTVDGQHSWVTYYNLQKASKINYHGYYTYVTNLTGTFQYTWGDELKKKGGFLIGTSPEEAMVRPRIELWYNSDVRQAEPFIDDDVVYFITVPSIG
ncbi:hypothetical protein NECAME_09626 [Necator americanus]|uniref:EndoU domain-containing protein n=1 Tax=Necator americanus TaxID=51031 RepID=W2TDA8_NECAM|nr:hypothetical protein NECAME_09626 [Necator americanus]ETN79793.1 hypothetical protein NECAME_09626 [Necator americanus]